MDQGKREKLVRDYWGEVWSNGRVELLADLFTDPFQANEEELSTGEFGVGVTSWLEKFPDFAVTVDQVWHAHNTVITRVTYTGTQTGDFKVLPATGLPIKCLGLDTFEFEDDRIRQHWHAVDHLEMFEQLGATVAPAAKPEPARMRV